MRIVAFVAAWFYAAFIKDNTTAAFAVDSSRSLPVMSSAKIFRFVNLMQLDIVGITCRSVPAVYGVIPDMLFQQSCHYLPIPFINGCLA